MGISEDEQLIGVDNREVDPRMRGVDITRATVDHYLRNKLGGVVSPLDQLSEEDETPERVRTAINRALDGVKAVVDILNRLNSVEDLSRLKTVGGTTYIDLDQKEPDSLTE